MKESAWKNMQKTLLKGEVHPKELNEDLAEEWRDDLGDIVNDLQHQKQFKKGSIIK